MANCFPALKYLYIFSFFLIAFILYSTSKRMELLGLGLFFGVNVLFSGSLGLDVLNFLQSPTRHSWLNGLAGWAIGIGLVFNMVSSIFLVIVLTKLKTEFEVKGKPLELNGENRDKLNVLKNTFISSVVLLAAISLNVYFTTGKIQLTIETLINNLANTQTSPQIMLVFLTYSALVIGLWGVMIDILYFKYKEDDALQPFREYFNILSGMLGGLVGIDIIRLLIIRFGKSHLGWFIYNSIGVDILFDLLKWAMALISVVFSGLLIERYTKLEDPKNTYKKYHFQEVFSSFITFTFITLLMILSNSVYFGDMILLVIKFFAPLAVLGITSYNVYLSNSMLRLSREKLTE